MPRKYELTVIYDDGGDTLPRHVTSEWRSIADIVSAAQIASLSVGCNIGPMVQRYMRDKRFTRCTWQNRLKTVTIVAEKI